MTKRAGQPLGSELLPIDWRILGYLGSYASAYPSLATVARDLDVTRRWVRQRLALLEAAGYVERVPVFERPDDAQWLARGRQVEHKGRQTSNTYRLAATRGDTPRKSGQTGNPQVSATANRANVSASLPTSTAVATTVSRGGEWRWHIKFADGVLPQLDHDPTRSELLGTLESAFGPVQVRKQWRNVTDLPKRKRRRRRRQKAA